MKKVILLIGNTNWHWGVKDRDKWSFFDELPNTRRLDEIGNKIVSWCSVGYTPEHKCLNKYNKLTNAKVPDIISKPWIGIDRLIGIWSALDSARSQRISLEKGLLVIDAGTIMSFSYLNKKHTFKGGLLVPGLNAQLNAINTSGHNLMFNGEICIPKDRFPITTEDAILQGIIRSLTTLICETQEKLQCPTWLCGGESSIFAKSLSENEKGINVDKNLILKGYSKIIDLNH